MELTEREQRMVQRMRKQERQWRWAKWAALLAGILSAAGCIFVLCMAMPQVQSEDTASGAFMLAIMFPVVLVFAGTAAMCLGLVCRDWHGNTTRSLLLRLVDGSAERKAK